MNTFKTLMPCSYFTQPVDHTTVCFQVFSSICLELTDFIHHQQRLSNNLQISEAENLLILFIFRL